VTVKAYALYEGLMLLMISSNSLVGHRSIKIIHDRKCAANFWRNVNPNSDIWSHFSQAAEVALVTMDDFVPPFCFAVLFWRIPPGETHNWGGGIFSFPTGEYGDRGLWNCEISFSASILGQHSPDGAHVDESLFIDLSVSLTQEAS
jgi:hypothetical protein